VGAKKLGIQAEKSGKKGTGARLARFPGCQVVRLARLGSEAGHDQPRPPRRLALTVETKRRQIKGALVIILKVLSLMSKLFAINFLKV